MFKLAGVSKSFGEHRALDAVDLVLDAGKTTALIGPSGCGKSTLLRIMMGLVAPDAGALTFGSEALTPATALRLRQRMGYVIQDGGLFPHLTAAENVTLMARFLGWSPEACARRIGDLCALTRFPADGLRRYPVEISGGQRQRVSLMRALMLDPEVLLLDEPLAALDPMIRSELQADLKGIFRQLGKTVVLVTHDMAEAAFLGDVVVLVKAGRIVQRGAVADLLERPADPFVTAFVNAQRSSLWSGGRE